jgi:CRP-like cAMP-binding protein
MKSEAPAVLDANEDILSLPLFQGVEADLVHGLAASARRAQHAKGTVFLAQGQPIARFYIVLEGWCGVSKCSPEGQDSILQVFRRGDFLPEPDHTGHVGKSPVNLQALSAVWLLMVSPSAVRNALERSKSFMANMLAVSIRRSQELRDHVEQLTLYNAEERVGRFLLQMRLYTSLNGSDITLPFDKSFVAAYLGIKPETLSRTLQFFRERGFMIERNHFVLPDRQALCAYCNSFTSRSCRRAHAADCPNRAHNEGIIV